MTESHFTKILNFRDVSSSVTGLKPGFFFRSGSAEKASIRDLDLLLRKYQIQAMVDLRSERERRSDSESSSIYSAFVPVRSLRGAKQVKGRKIYQMRFIGTSFIAHLFTGAPMSVSLYEIGMTLARAEPEKATLLLVNSLNSRGLLNLYNMFLENCKSHLCEVLQTFLDPMNYPIHVFCSLGKDRTGLITALILSCVGVPRDQICKDYARSNEVNMTASMKNIIGAVSQNSAEQEFLSAPAEIMQKTLEYLDIKYGSVSEYLARIGFDKYMQAQLRALLSVTSEVPQLERGIVRSKSTPELCPTGVPGAKAELSKDVEAVTLAAKGPSEQEILQPTEDHIVPPQMTEEIRREGQHERGRLRERFMRRIGYSTQQLHSETTPSSQTTPLVLKKNHRRNGKFEH